MTSFSNRCRTHTLPFDSRARFLAASITRGETSEWSTATSSLSYIDQPHSLGNGLSHGPFLYLYDERETSATPEDGPGFPAARTLMTGHRPSRGSSRCRLAGP